MTDTYKVLGQVESTAGAIVPFYTTPAGKQAVSSSLSIVNTGEVGTAYSIFAVPASEYSSVFIETDEFWTQVGQDIDGEAAEDSSGFSVSLSADGSRLAIGAPYNDNNTNNNGGHVRVYSWTGTAWVQLGDDFYSQWFDEYSGHSVSLSADGSRVAIGAPGNDDSGTNVGQVRIYDWNGTFWTQAGVDINGEGAFDQSGHSVSLSADGSRVAIGAPGNDGNSSNLGHVRVFDWNGFLWLQIGGDIDGEALGDESGSSVSLSADGSRVAIGARLNDGNGEATGHVRVYQLVDNAWVKLGDDIDGEAFVSNQSGFSVSLSADGLRVAIGAPYNLGWGGFNLGHVRIYEWNGTAWIQLGQDIDGEAVGDFSGWSVSLSADGSRVAIGAPFNDGNGEATGHVRVYQLVDNAWVKLGGDIDGEAVGDFSGWSVSLSADGSRVAIGAPVDGQVQSGSGHVRVFEYFPESVSIVPQNKHTLINSKTISSGVHDEIVGGIQLSAGDALLVSSPSGDVVFNMYGVETL